MSCILLPQSGWRRRASVARANGGREDGREITRTLDSAGRGRAAKPRLLTTRNVPLLLRHCCISRHVTRMSWSMLSQLPSPSESCPI